MHEKPLLVLYTDGTIKKIYDPALLFAICLDLRVFQAGRRARFVALLENVLTEAVVARAFTASAGFARGGVAGFAVHGAQYSEGRW